MTTLRLDLLRSVAPILVGAALLPACGLPDVTGADTEGTGGADGDGTDGASSGGTSGVPGDCTELGAADIASDTTLPAGCYSVPQLLLVENRIDMEPGVEIYFAQLGGLMVTGGVVSAVGTADLPVVMTGATEQGWQGVQFLGASSSDNRLEYVELDGAADVGVDIGSASRLTVHASDISGAPGFGLVAHAGAEVTITQTTFADNEIPLAVALEAVEGIGSDNVFTDNAEQIVQVEGGSLADAAQWASPGVPLRLTGNINVESDLVLDPGLEIEMPLASQITVATTGSLSAPGTAEAPIVLRGTEDERGFWVGLSIASKASANVMTGCVLENGGSDGWNGSPDSVGMIWLEDEAKLVMSGSTLRGSDGPALNTFGDADVSGFADNVIENNHSTIQVPPGMVHQIEASNTFTGNDEQFIRVGRIGANNAVIDTTATWQALGIPYRVIDRFFVESAWTVAAGATVEVVQDRKIVIEPGGSLQAVGTADAPIVFMGAEQLAGYWQGLEIGSVSASNELQFVELHHAGSDPFNGNTDSDGAIYLPEGSLTISDSLISESGGYGIVVWNDAQLLGCGNVTFTDNAKADTFVWDETASSACP